MGVVNSRFTLTQHKMKLFAASVLALAAVQAEAYYVPYGYGGYGYGGYYGKRSAEAQPEAKPDAKADPYYVVGYYGYPAYSYGYYGKRSADAEPEAKPYYAYGYPAYGYGYYGKSPLMPSQRQSPTMLPMATQPTATAIMERGPLMPSQRQSLTMATATQPTATATTERGQ